MFDLLEEELATKEESPHSNAKTPPPIDAVVYTMPEKFRRGAPKSNSKPLIIIVLILLLLAATGGVLFFVFSAPQKQEPPAEQKQPGQGVQGEQQQPAGEEVKGPLEDQTASQETSATTTEATTTQAADGVSPDTPVQEPSTEEPVSGEPTDGGGEVKLPTILAVDSDKDGLTDTEERLYNTNSQIQDTDGDGFTDGEEVEHLFDPLRPDGARLEISGRVTPYTNPTFSYSLYYPSSWSSRAVNESDKEVVISSALGEFISVKVQDNPQSLGAIDWYVALVDPSADTSQLQTLSFNNWTGVMAPDGLSAYLVKTDETGSVIAPYVYSFLYNQDTSAQPQFLTTFRMMLRSFVFTDLSFVR